MTDPTYRMSMLPFGTYPNENGQGEHLGFAVPGAIQEPINALMRLFVGSEGHPATFPLGPDYGVESDNPWRSAHPNAQDMGTLGATFYGGNALSPVRAVESVLPLLLSDTGKPSLMGSAIAGTSPSPQSVSHDLFSRSLNDAAQYFNMSPSEFNAAANPGTIKYRGYRGVHPMGNSPVSDLAAGRDEVFASSSPAVAGTYAATDIPDAAMFPLDMTFSNPLIVQGEGQKWNAIPWNNKTSSTDEIARQARANGHDGLVVKNIRDSQTHSQNELGAIPPADTYIALKRGTVTSPLTGETLFSDQLPSLFGAALSPYNQEQRNALWDY